MKNSHILLSWAILFYATALLATGGVANVAWVIGFVCMCAGLFGKLD